MISKSIIPNNMNDVSIFGVSEDKDIIYIDDIDYADCPSLSFIMLTNDGLNHDYSTDNTIFISTRWNDFVGKRFIHPEVFKMKSVYPEKFIFNNVYTYKSIEYVNLLWQADLVNIPNTRESNDDEITNNPDYNGYDNTHSIITNAMTLLNKPMREKYFNKCETIDEYIPAVMGAYRAELSFDGQNIHGFLPSIEQLMIISRYVESINTILGRIGMSELPMDRLRGTPYFFLDGILWSSSINDDVFIWTSQTSGSIFGTYNTNIKITLSLTKKDANASMMILPLFKITL